MKLKKEEAKRIARDYSLGKIRSIKPLTSGWVNHSFDTKADKGNFIIQIIGDRYDEWKKRKVKMQFLVLNYLAKKKFPYETPLPIKNKNGEYLLKLGKKYLWVYKKIEGEIYSRLNLNQFKQVAVALAKYHTRIKHLTCIDNDFFNFDWQLGEYARLRKIKPKNKVDKLMLNNLDFFESIWKRIAKIDFRGNMVITHSDFNNDNMLFRNGNLVGIIDFDGVELAPVAKDISLAIKRSPYPKRGINDRKMKIFLQEYEKINKLSDKEKSLIIPVLIKDNCTVFYWYYDGMKKYKSERYNCIKDTIKETKELVKKLR